MLHFTPTEADKTILRLMPSVIQHVPKLSQSEARPPLLLLHIRPHFIYQLKWEIIYFLGIQ